MKEILLSEADNRPGAVQAAVDSLAGGGQIVIPPGRWPVGDLRLGSGVRLRLASNCTLEGAVMAEDVADVAVVGEGMDASVVTGGLHLRQVRGVECAGWSGRAVAGNHVSGGQFRGLRLHQPPQRQGEGSVVWFRWCRDLHWADCDLESNDDVFCLKRAAENVTLTRSRLCGRLAAPFKIGTETDGLFRDIAFTDSVIERSDRAAISLESVDGAEVRDVRIERIRMDDVNAPLFIRLGDRDRYARGLGDIHDILIADVEGFGETMDEGFGSCISGLPQRAVRNVVLRDIRFVSRGGQGAELAGRAVPERAELYPEFDMFGRLPAHGLYARHVRGLRLERVSWTTRRPDGRPAIVLEADVRDVEIIDAPAPQVRPAPPAGAGERESLPAGDVDALLAAVAAAKAGGTVIVEPGDYAIPRERLPIVLDRPGLVLRSREGPQRTHVRAVGARENDAQYRPVVTPELARQIDTLLFIAADGVKVSGLTLSGAVYNVYVAGAADCEVAGNCFDFSKCYHVCACDAKRLVVADNRSRAALNNSITLQRCRECVVRGNTFEEDPGAVRLRQSPGNLIAANRMLAVSWHGVMLEPGSHDSRIEGNLFADGRLTGVQVRGCDGVRITGNEFRGQKTESVLADRGSRGLRLRGNSFHDNRGLAVGNETPHAVDAAGNWWGRPEGPGGGAEVDANVIVEPWLTDCPVRL